ncbi:MAG TPA: NUDIX domain-containing protein [Acidobacteriota bacterium]|nr:NUDIX hydrolase [Acidobacteriota bacterium]HOS99748.1 NUDIX domain-containing protein [Acidobacteriota bacterium]HQF86094.1 NUDIX domain-containing protein [Acidobacteriota bacterium]HQG90663.1 NUDIX domain-containing protein [Acidobacteriota bacterium]HQK88721.1 NUDIX domain-containing protein [Acidobacteriota bacterium]
MSRNVLERPVVAVDVVALRAGGGRLEVLLIRRAEEPFAGAEALPGVALRADETLESAAVRALVEKAACATPAAEDLYMEQLATFGALYRDPRGRTVSIAYLALAREGELTPVRGRWTAATGRATRALPFDHETIVAAAVSRLKGKLRYTNIARHLLPPEFRIEELQAVYEAVLGWKVNRTNFRSLMLQRGLIERVRILAEAVGRRGGRPPHLYRFTGERVAAEDRDFL